MCMCYAGLYERESDWKDGLLLTCNLFANLLFVCLRAVWVEGSTQIQAVLLS